MAFPTLPPRGRQHQAPEGGGQPCAAETRGSPLRKHSNRGVCCRRPTDRPSKYFHLNFTTFSNPLGFCVVSSGGFVPFSFRIKKETELMEAFPPGKSAGPPWRGGRSYWPGKTNSGEQAWPRWHGADSLPHLPAGRDRGAGTEGEQRGQRRTGKDHTGACTELLMAGWPRHGATCTA